LVHFQNALISLHFWVYFMKSPLIEWVGIKDFNLKTYVIHWINMGHLLSDADMKSDPKETSTRRKSNLF
jgi:hypothetical protein